MPRLSYRRRYRRYRPRTRRSAPRRRIFRRRNYRRRLPVGNPRRRGIATERNMRINFQGDRSMVKFKNTSFLELTPVTGTDLIPTQTFTYGGNYVAPAEIKIPNLDDYTDSYKKARIVRCSIVMDVYNQHATNMRTVGISQMPTDSVLPSPGPGVNYDEQPRTVSASLGPLSSSKSYTRLKATGTIGTAIGTNRYTTLGDGDFIVVTPTTGLGAAPQYAWNWIIWVQDSFSNPTTAPIKAKVKLYYTVEFSFRRIETQ